MEITNELKQDLSTLESACGNFLEKYESVLTSALNKQEMSAEESLKIDLILIQDPSGSFTLGGTPLPPMTDIEVYVHDDELDQDVWKRVFIGGSPKQRICGLKHPNLTSGIHARIRG